MIDVHEVFFIWVSVIAMRKTQFQNLFKFRFDFLFQRFLIFHTLLNSSEIFDNAFFVFFKYM